MYDNFSEVVKLSRLHIKKVDNEDGQEFEIRCPFCATGYTDEDDIRTVDCPACTGIASFARKLELLSIRELHLAIRHKSIPRLQSIAEALPDSEYGLQAQLAVAKLSCRKN